MKPSNVADKLRSFRGQLFGLEPDWTKWGRFESWAAGVRPFLRRHFPDDLQDFTDLVKTPRWLSMPRAEGDSKADRGVLLKTDQQRHWANNALVRSTREKLLAFLDALIRTTADEMSPATSLEDSWFRRIENLLTRFHKVAQQLAKRH